MGIGGNATLRVFISYRRGDSIGVAGRIRDRLASQLGDDNVFFDVDTVPLGVDFRRHIDRMVADCDVVLVIIGPRWVDAVDERGDRRLDQTGDFVRLEVEAALRREIPVVPLLVDGATIPLPSQLPESIVDLAYRNGTVVRHDPDFHPDVDRLLRGLGRATDTGPADSVAGVPDRPEPSATDVVEPDAATPVRAAASAPELPVTPGSRFAPPANRPTVPNWHPDPAGVAHERFWDGQRWWSAVRDGNGASYTDDVTEIH